MKQFDFTLLQPHTVQIYELRNKVYEIRKVSARKLLIGIRFDIFAKLYYIRRIKDAPEDALAVYKEHIKAFNPDLREPGRDDKNSLDDFVNAFDMLISIFKNEEFKDDVSIVPVDSNGVILDGAHRIAALAFYDRQVTVAQFTDVYSKGEFNYDYFKYRGLSSQVLNKIALEMTQWLPNIKVACIWPSVQNKSFAINLLKNIFQPIFELDLKFSLKQLEDFIGVIYSHQPWTSNLDAVKDKAIHCFGNGNVRFVLFESCDNDNLIRVKSDIRDFYKLGNHSVHITDNQQETIQIAEMIFAEQCEYKPPVLQEKWEYFKRVQWINFKVYVAKVIRKLGIS